MLRYTTDDFNPARIVTAKNKKRNKGPELFAPGLSLWIVWSLFFQRGAAQRDGFLPGGGAFCGQGAPCTVFIAPRHFLN